MRIRRRALVSVTAITFVVMSGCIAPPKAPELPPMSTPVVPTLPTPPTAPTTTVPPADELLCPAEMGSTTLPAPVVGSQVWVPPTLDTHTAASDARDVAAVGDTATITAVAPNGDVSFTNVAPEGVVLATNMLIASGAEIAGVETDGVAKIADDGPPPSNPLRWAQWDLDDVKFEDLWGITSQGDGITVAVIDTGVDGTHPDFDGRVEGGISFVCDTEGAIGGGSVDDNGHGTHVAGIVGAGDNTVGIVGSAPGVTLLPVKVLNENGEGDISDVARGIQWAVTNGADVINMSLGYEGDSPAVNTAIAAALAAGVPVVAAAGNSGVSSPVMSPASIDGVIAVASYGSNGVLAPSSTRGPYVDVAAPGVHIASTYPDDQWVYLTGTSMAAPHVTGLVALLVAHHPGYTAEQYGDAITGSADDAGPAGFDDGYGWGKINVLAADAAMDLLPDI